MKNYFPQHKFKMICISFLAACIPFFGGMYFFSVRFRPFYFFSWSRDIPNPIAIGPFEKVLKCVKRISELGCSHSKQKGDWSTWIF